MKTTKMLLLATAVAAGISFAGCSKIKSLIGGKPSGQVVAKVNGQEITVTELNQETRGLTSRDPKVIKRVQQAALQRIIVRDLLVQQAREAKMDKAPDYTLQVRRGELDLLAQRYQQKMASSVAVPSRQDGEAFVQAHPDMFAKRRILILDQVIAGQAKLDANKLKPLKTLPEVKALLTAEGIGYQENVSTLDTLSANQNVVEQISKLPPDDVFIVPTRGAVVFNHVSETRSVPFTGDMAISYAINVLRNQRAQQSVGDQTLALYNKSKPSIVYSAGYGPPPDAPKTAPGAPAAAAPAAAAPAAPATPPAK